MKEYIFEPEGYHIFGLVVGLIGLLGSYVLELWNNGKNDKKVTFIHISLFFILFGFLLGDSFIKIEINNFRIVEIIESKYPERNKNEILLLDEYSRFIKFKGLTDKSILNIKESNKIYQSRSFIGIERQNKFKKITF